MREFQNVLFIGSKNNLLEEIEYYRAIVSSIHRYGHSLASDWIEPAYLRAIHKKPNEIIDWSYICKANVDIIPNCDAVIADISTRSFGVGYEVGLAVAQKKPTLLLRRAGVSETILLGGLESKYLDKADYTLKNVHELIGEFLEKDDTSLKDIRFNLLIDKKINSYLKEASSKRGETKAELIRGLIIKDMKRGKGF